MRYIAPVVCCVAPHHTFRCVVQTPIMRDSPSAPPQPPPPPTAPTAVAGAVAATGLPAATPLVYDSPRGGGGGGGAAPAGGDGGGGGRDDDTSAFRWA